MKKRKNKEARISLIQTVPLSADSSALVQVEGNESTNTTYLMLELDQSWHDTLMVNSCLIRNDGSGSASIIVFNTSLYTQVLKEGMCLGKVAKVDLIHSKADEIGNHLPEGKDDSCVMNVRTFSNEHIHWRKQELRKQVKCYSNSQVLSLAA